MSISILHDQHGTIIAVAKIDNLQKAGSKFVKAGMVPARGQRVLEVELSKADANRPVREIHAAYRVDVATSKLVKKESKPVKKGSKPLKEGSKRLSKG